MEPSLGGNPAGAGEAGLIKDSGIETFVKDVIEASMERPILVDFWAPWCGPCKQLTPALEKTVKAAGGRVALVKVNIDENQQIAQQLRIQSIPAVFVFDKGQPVDGFVGNQPESQIRAMIERVAGPGGPSPMDEMLEFAAGAIAAGDLASAAQAYGQVLQEDKANPIAIAGLARCNMLGGNLEGARQVLALTPVAGGNHPEIVAVRAALELEELSQSVGDLTSLEAAISSNPADHQSRFDLAVGLAAKGDNEDAARHLLEIIRKDRKWNEEAARKQLVRLFEILGPEDPVTMDSRRKLSAILFS
ncbi:MAG: thioredoxin [Alphaproteobacteria bacterium]|nr:thioredoxin [Alphaproteobacteria bacterium]